MKVLPEAQTTFTSFWFNLFQDIHADSLEFMVIQHFVVLLYARTSPHKLVNDARLALYFNKKNPNLEHIPPTADALLEHSKRAGYQTIQAHGELPWFLNKIFHHLRHLGGTAMILTATGNQFGSHKEKLVRNAGN